MFCVSSGKLTPQKTVPQEITPQKIAHEEITPYVYPSCESFHLWKLPP